MFRSTRSLHKWIGVCAALFLAVIAGTGFLLANKARFGWMRPPAMKGGSIGDLSETVSLHTAAEAAIALGRPEIREWKDIERIDYRPKHNIFKVISQEGYLEVQVDGKSGDVLSQSFRTDQLTEHIHDFSFFADWAHAWVLPTVALLLLGLAISGIIIFSVPYIRRARFRRRQSAPKE